MARVRVYIDGFNLYYSRLKGKRGVGATYKWLNLVDLCDRLFAHHTVTRVKLFSARTRPSPFDPSIHRRQEAYFRALATVDRLELIEGLFVERPQSFITRRGMEQTPPVKDFVEVMKIEEKGSDVNLGSHLVFDGLRGEYDFAAVVSNDSDLTEPIRLMTQEFGISVILVPPMYPSNSAKRKGPQVRLKAAATDVWWITDAMLRAAQFDDPHVHEGINYPKPIEW